MNSDEVYSLIEQIAATSSKTEKERLLAEHADDPTLRFVLKWTLDPFITFGIRPDRPAPRKTGALVAGDWFDASKSDYVLTAYVELLLQRLAERELSGNEARNAYQNIIGLLTNHSAELLWRIIRKDLRAGFSENTVHKAIPGLLPKFSIMLSHPFEEKRIKVWPVAVEPKLDGFRATGMCEKGGAKFYSRTGNHFPSLDHFSDPINQMLVKALADLPESSSDKTEQFFRRLLNPAPDGTPRLMLDAEVMSGNFKKTSGDIKRGKPAVDAILNVFDAVPLRWFQRDDKIDIPFKIRRAFVEFLVRYADPRLIRATPINFAQSHEEIQEIYQQHRRTTIASYVARGDAALEKELLKTTVDEKTGEPKCLEGAMVKILDAAYVKSKGHLWMKMKAEETEDLQVIGWFEGKAATKLEGKFGGFIVDRQGVEVNIGGGYSDEQRELFHILCGAESVEVSAYVEKGLIKRKFHKPGWFIEIEFNEVTEDGSLRHPRFIRMRPDKDEKREAA